MFTTEQQSLIQQARAVNLLALTGTRGLRQSGREWSGPCPFCGAGIDRFNIQPHQNTWLCRTCTAGRYSDAIEFIRRRDGLGFLDAVTLLTEGALPLVPLAIQERPREPPPWQAPWWSGQGARLVHRYANHPRKLELWRGYKPVSAATIERYRLGVGVIPACPCRHERLIVPVWEAGRLVSLRGRAIGCACAKWMNAGGCKKTLCGLDGLAEGATVWIVENFVDGLLLQERYGWAALSPTTGVTTHWLPEWISRLAAARPQQVVVAFDNDAAGQRAGKRVASQLRNAGLRARLWEWPADAPPKADMGWYLTRGEI